MTWVVLVAVAVYAVLKAGQVAFLGRAAGYRAEPESLGRRLRTGEPTLLIVAVLISVPPALAGRWYHRHKFESVLTDSVACSALLQAYQRAPGIKQAAGDHTIYETIYDYRATALDAARQLGLDAGATRLWLDRSAAATIAESRRAGGSIDRARLAATRECLRRSRDPVA